MQIGELAERTGLSLRTIRHYDDEGLFTPSARSAGGFRLYSATDLDRLLVIRRMKPLGFSIDEMRELLTVVDELTAGTGGDAARARLEEFRTAARERRDTLQIQLSRAEEFVATLDALG
jgi:DNA-binding transcriptional MerR regulator